MLTRILDSVAPILISPPETMNSSDNISSLHSSAFSLEISSLYSVIVQPPTLTAWYGYVQIFTADSNLPPLYFHDEESRSTVLERDRRATALGALGPNQTSPQSESTIVHASWGGESLIQQLKLYAHLLRSAIEPNLFLINPSKEDTEVHSTSLFDDDALRAVNPRAGRNSILHQSLSGSSSSAYPDEIGAGVDNLTFSVLSSFSRITRSSVFSLRSSHILFLMLTVIAELVPSRKRQLNPFCPIPSPNRSSKTSPNRSLNSPTSQENSHRRTIKV